jgi:hypothetical protein
MKSKPKHTRESKEDAHESATESSRKNYETIHSYSNVPTSVVYHQVDQRRKSARRTTVIASAITLPRKRLPRSKKALTEWSRSPPVDDRVSCPIFVLSSPCVLVVRNPIRVHSCPVGSGRVFDCLCLRRLLGDQAHSHHRFQLPVSRFSDRKPNVLL